MHCEVHSSSSYNLMSKQQGGTSEASMDCLRKYFNIVNIIFQEKNINKKPTKHKLCRLGAGERT